MRKYSFFYGLIFCLCTLISSAHPNHGGEIFYRYLGGDSFELVVRQFETCKMIHVHPYPIIVSPKNGVTFSVMPTDLSFVDITPVCSKSCSKCTSSSCSFDFGIGMREYSATVNLSNYSECEFLFGVEASTRNAAISTGPGEQNIYFEAMLNRCKAGSHSSPRFANPPIEIWCKNQCGTVMQDAINDDVSDSLVYSITSPLAQHNVPVNYSAGYSYQQPFKFAGAPDTAFNASTCNGLRYDARTGAFNFRPVAADITVMAFKVNQYRKDSAGKYQLVGFIMRDFQMAIIECPEKRSDGKLNKIPSLSGINGTNAASIIACHDVELAFHINVLEVDKDDIVFSWDKSIPGASFTYSSNKATFKWTPKKEDVRKEPYYVTISVHDDWCPVPTLVQRKYAIYVKDSFPAYTYQKTDSICGRYHFSVKPRSSSAKLTAEWSIKGQTISTATEFTHRFAQNGSYVVQGYLKAPVGCGKYIYDKNHQPAGFRRRT